MIVMMIMMMIVMMIMMMIDLSKFGPLADHLRHTKIQTYNYIECREKYITAVGNKIVEINEDMVSVDN